MHQIAAIAGFALAIAVTATPVTAADKDERAGTCTDARSQMEYFCNTANSANDSLVSFGTACSNAKKNVAAACDGMVEADKAYKFDDK